MGDIMGKEYVFEFSGRVPLTPYIVALINKIVGLLGGKRFYIENLNKIVVVM